MQGLNKRKYTRDTIQLFFQTGENTTGVSGMEEEQESRMSLDNTNTTSVNDLITTTITTDDTAMMKKQEERNIGIVIAHPDDEAMFMTPTILSLTNSQCDTDERHDDNVRMRKKDDDYAAVSDQEEQQQQQADVIINVHILCLSTGNADGLGEQRISELINSCRLLKVITNHNEPAHLVISQPHEMKTKKSSKLVIVNHRELQDGMNNTWNHALISDFVKQFVHVNQIQTLLTFDKHGISGHPNHIDVHRGVLLCLRELGTSVIGYTLTTSNLVRKYIGILDFVVSITKDKTRESTVILFTPGLMSAYGAMKAHHSQLVWYRKLFLIFSRYAYVNTWERVTRQQIQ